MTTKAKPMKVQLYADKVIISWFFLIFKGATMFVDQI